MLLANLHLYEKFFLFAYAQKGKRWVFKRPPLSVAHHLAVALLVELALLGRIGLTDDQAGLYVIRPMPTDDPLLDDVLEYVGRNSLSTGDWVSQEKIALMGDLLAIPQKLLKLWYNRGLIEIEEHRFLGVFPQVWHVLKSGVARVSLQDHLREVIFNRADANWETEILLLLIQTCWIHDQITSNMRETNMLWVHTNNVFPDWLPPKGEVVGVLEVPDIHEACSAAIGEILIGIEPPEYVR
ncbi:MAG: GPP34 family phosphoprotein [Phototrophicales bacterium]|nr:GPP34 family phosphoprotein [Phototrophicales bacterium]